MSAARAFLFLGRRRIAEHRQVFEVIAVLHRLIGETIVVRLMQFEMANRFEVVLGVGILQALRHCLCNDVLNSILIEMVQVFAGAHVAIGRVIGAFQHLVVVFGSQQKPHRAVLEREGPRREPLPRSRRRKSRITLIALDF